MSARASERVRSEEWLPTASRANKHFHEEGGGGETSAYHPTRSTVLEAHLIISPHISFAGRGVLFYAPANTAWPSKHFFCFAAQPPCSARHPALFQRTSPIFYVNLHSSTMVLWAPRCRYHRFNQMRCGGVIVGRGGVGGVQCGARYGANWSILVHIGVNGQWSYRSFFSVSN